MNSKELFERACRVIPGGVNSPVRAFNSVGGTPFYVESGKGCRIKTSDGIELIDFCTSWGPLILGHANEEVNDNICRAAKKGTTFGINTEAEIELAEFITSQISYVDMVRLVSSGTEAVMSAIRLARGFTGRNKIIKFAGCYHGHSDALLVAAGSGLLTNGKPSSEGVPDSVVKDTIVLDYNNKEDIISAFKKYKEDIAAIIIEPVAGNMGLVKADIDYLMLLKEITEENNSLLIFDEVISGFRFSPTTYGDMIGIKPDLTTLGKIIGGGMPIGAVCGKRSIMHKFSPLGGVYQAGTLSGNPVAVAAGLTTLKILKRENLYEKINFLGKRLYNSISTVKSDINFSLSVFKGAFTIFFTQNKPHNLLDVQNCDQEIFKKFFHFMLSNGVYISPSQFELNFISSEHSEKEIDFLSKLTKEFLTQK